MKNDPYSEMVSMMRNEGSKNNPPTIQFADVSSVEPLKIKLGDIELDKDNLLIADYLLSNYSRQINTPLALNIDGETELATVGDHGSHKHNISSLKISGSISFTDAFKKGDVVAVMPTGNVEKFVILARVVRL